MLDSSLWEGLKSSSASSLGRKLELSSLSPSRLLLLVVNVFPFLNVLKREALEEAEETVVSNE